MHKLVQITFGTLVVVALSAPAAFATTIVNPSPIIVGPVGGPYTWSYNVQLGGNSQITNGDFFTIFDFAGLVAGSQFGAAGWTITTPNTGSCPVQILFAAVCAATDSAATPNLVFTRTGGTIVGPGAGNSVSLGNFGAMSIFNLQTNDFFVSQDDDLGTGTNDEGAGGNTNVPVAGVTVVPEPASMLLLGTGLLALAARARRVRS